MGPAFDLPPIPLENAHVRLEPLEPRHRAPLQAAAATDPDTFRWWPRVMSDWDAAFDWQMQEHEAGRWRIHAVVTPEGRLVGQTCFLALRPEHAGVEIGGTWYAPEARGSRVNPAAKLLLMTRAFACGAERIELKTDALNVRSRAAMEKLGLVFEGVHRRHMRRPDGTMRDTAWYSVLREEWPAMRARLEQRLAGAE